MIQMELLIVIGVIFLIALILTIYSLRRMENQMNSYEEEGVTVEEERERSLRYETESFKKHLPAQVIMYTIFFILSILGIIFYII